LGRAISGISTSYGDGAVDLLRITGTSSNAEGVETNQSLMNQD
jgi:hypothetical protein